MNSKVKICIGVSIISIMVIGIIIFTVTTINQIKEKEKIENVAEIYTEENVQEKLETQEVEEVEELCIQEGEKSTIGVIKIDKIEFEGLIYEGTSLDILEIGVGHFESSPYIDGNVCLAAHNTNKFWSKLNTLEIGDKITYISFLGTREYQVTSKEEILETDWSKLQNTEENIITLITCVKGKPELRLCVQGVQVG